MGISRRNPRGNFNWQSRMLKRRAICCGDLDVPFDCDALAPVIQVTGNLICRSKLSPTNATVSVTNTASGQAATTFFEWRKGGLAGPVIYSGFGPTLSVTFTPAQQNALVNGLVGIVATNAFGCVSETEFFLAAFNIPETSIIPTASTDPCLPDLLAPSGFSSNGAISVSNSAPDANALYYVWNISYGSSTPNPGFTDSFTGTGVTHIWTNLCDGNYTVSLELWVSLDGVPTKVCDYPEQTVFLGPLILTWDDIANVPVVNPADVSQWNTLAFSNITFIGATVIGNSVYLTPSSSGIITTSPVNAIWYRDHLVSIEDKSGCIEQVYSLSSAQVLDTVILQSCLVVGLQAFLSSTALTNVKMDSVTTIGNRAFEKTGPFNASFPSCISIGFSSFYDSQITNADFPLLQTIPQSAFYLAVNMSTTSFPSVQSLGRECFTQSGITNAYFPNALTASDKIFSGCLNLVSVDMPLLTTVSGIGIGGFLNGCSALTSLNLPELTTFNGPEQIRDCTSLVTLDLPKLVTATSTEVFRGNTALQTVNLPLVQSIGLNAFTSCTSLIDINIPVILNIGPSNFNDGVFALITGNNITVTAPLAKKNVFPGVFPFTMEQDLYELYTNNTVTFNWV